jgi:hypothetical protein
MRYKRFLKAQDNLTGVESAFVFSARLVLHSHSLASALVQLRVWEITVARTVMFVTVQLCVSFPLTRHSIVCYARGGLILIRATQLRLLEVNQDGQMSTYLNAVLLYSSLLYRRTYLEVSHDSSSWQLPNIKKI